MADNKKPQFEKGNTPVGIAVYPWLNRADTKHKAEGVYKTNLILGAEETVDLRAKLDAAAQKAYDDAVEALKKEPKKKPKLLKLQATTPFTGYKDQIDEATGDPTGNFDFGFKMNAKVTAKVGPKAGQTFDLKPVFFDAKGSAIKGKVPAIYGGSKLRVSFEIVPFYNASADCAGVTLRMSAIKIIELAAGRGADAAQHGFGGDEGDYVADQKDDAGDFGDGDGDGEGEGDGGPSNQDRADGDASKF